MRGLAYSIAREKGADGALFTDSVNRLYVAGFNSSEGAALCTEKGTALILDMRYAVSAENAKLDGVKVVRSTKGINADLKEYAVSLGIKSLIVESTALTLYDFARLEKALEGIKLIPVANINGDARQIKTAAEISCIKKAQRITDACFNHILGYIKRGMTERQVAAEMEYFMKKQGADGVAFDTIAVSGKKSALPHGVPGDELLTENAFFTMDFGARYGGYCSDMTRTVVLGKADDKMKEIYDTVLGAQLAGVAAVADGVPCSGVDAAARDYIKERGYGQYFTHSTGHSLGLEIHESPSCSPKSEAVLKTGMLMTVEPGIYIEGYGGVRIEDTVLVKDTGCEVLATSTKELLEL